MSVEQYLDLLDGTGRQVVSGKRAAIPNELAGILSRLDIDDRNWLELAHNFGHFFQRVAGRPECHSRIPTATSLLLATPICSATISPLPTLRSLCG
jgi:hypothetical protein